MAATIYHNPKCSTSRKTLQHLRDAGVEPTIVKYLEQPPTRAELEKTIAEALDGHLCRCTGYIKYHEAVRAVILADPGRYLS